MPVAGSQALLSRMVANVIDNAIVHNEHGRLDHGDRGRGRGGTARLVVENGGLELAAEQVAQLAQPFRRVGPERTGSDGGSGLGLSIVAAIAAAHGGELDLQPRPAGGLRVVITLPLASGPGSPQPLAPGRVRP